MEILGISHIGIAPKNPEAAKHFFYEVLGLSLLGEELVAEQKTQTVMFSSSSAAKPDESRLELLLNQEGQLGPIKKFLDQRGGGVHHVALRVRDVQEAIAYLKAKGVKMIDESPRIGAHDTQVAFVHPSSAGGVLVELVNER